MAVAGDQSVSDRSTGASTVGEGSRDVAMAPNPFIDMELAALRGSRYDGAARSRFWTALRLRARENAAARPDLRAELRFERWLGAILALGVGFELWREGVPAILAVVLLPLGWLVVMAWVGVELGLVRHPVTGSPGPRIGPANLMTLYRGWAAVPVLLIGLSRPGPTLAWVALCLAAGVTDFADGLVAVRLGHESRLGRVLDPVLDACFFSAAAVGLARWGLFPTWLAVLIALRYFAPVVGGLALMFIQGRTLPVKHTPWGQRSTVAIGFALLVNWAAGLVAIPIAAILILDGSALLTMALALLSILRDAPTRIAAGERA